MGICYTETFPNVLIEHADWSKLNDNRTNIDTYNHWYEYIYVDSRLVMRVTTKPEWKS